MSSSLRRPVFCLLLAIAAAAGLSGCLKVEARLDANGGGTIKMEFVNLDKERDARVREQLISPGVKLLSAEYADSVGRYEVAFTDARKLRTAPLFRHLKIDHTGADTRRRIASVSFPRRERTADEKNLPDDSYVYIDFKLTVPGTIEETNGEREGEGTAHWQIRIEDMFGKGFVQTRTVYNIPAPEPQE